MAVRREVALVSIFGKTNLFPVEAVSSADPPRLARMCRIDKRESLGHSATLSMKKGHKFPYGPLGRDHYLPISTKDT
jgi:hypothetical protein